MSVQRRAIALRLALAVAFGFIGCGGSAGSAAPSSTPAARTPASAPPASATPASAPPSAAPAADLMFPEAGSLPAGNHDAAVEGISFTFAAPSADWTADHGKTWAKLDLDRVAPPDGLPDGAAVIFWSPDGAYIDPCAHTRGEPVGSTPADLAAAMSTVPGVVVKRGPTETTLGGLPAVQLELVVPEEAACAPNDLFLWYDTVDAWRWATALGDQLQVWIVEVDGARLVVEAETRKAPGSATAAEVQGLVNSIRFD